MEARILSKDEEQRWDEFVANSPLANIQQTSSWAHFQEGIPARGKYWIIGVGKSPKHPSAGTLLVRYSLPKGYSWLYAPKGPLLNYNSPASKEEMNAFLQLAKEIAKKEKAIFLRIEPGIQKPPKFPGFRKTKSGFQPQHTLIIDLTKSEEEILAQMKQKGRYNIRLAEKKGVQIVESDQKNSAQFEKDLKDFYEILTQTTTRDGFHGHNLDYYKTMLQTLSSTGAKSPCAKLYLAKYNGQTLAAVIATYFKDTATYYYGASSNTNREVMAPYLLHWQIMKDAKAQGYKFYDMFGISPANAKNHPWQSVTEFKKKFGGTEISFQPAQEYGFKKLLHVGYKLYKKLK